MCIRDRVKRLLHRLAVIDAACCLADIDMPGYRLHPLSGDRDGIWALSVSGNWRITFEFVNGDAYILDYEEDVYKRQGCRYTGRHLRTVQKFKMRKAGQRPFVSAMARLRGSCKLKPRQEQKPAPLRCV